jgi:hypothetical protein
MKALEFDVVQSRMLAELGAVADVHAFGVGLAGWQSLLDLPEEQGWSWRYTEDGVSAPLRSAKEIFSDLRGVSCRFEFAAASRVPLHTAFFVPNDVELWFLPWQIASEEQLDDLCAALRLLGRSLQSDVVVSRENHPKVEHFRYDVGLDVFIG